MNAPLELTPDMTDGRVVDLTACAELAEHLAIKLRGVNMLDASTKAKALAQQCRTKAAHEALDAAREKPMVLEVDTRNCMLVAAERAATTGRDQWLQGKGTALCVAETPQDGWALLVRVTPGGVVESTPVLRAEAK